MAKNYYLHIFRVPSSSPVAIAQECNQYDNQEDEQRHPKSQTHSNPDIPGSIAIIIIISSYCSHHRGRGSGGRRGSSTHSGRRFCNCMRVIYEVSDYIICCFLGISGALKIVCGMEYSMQFQEPQKVLTCLTH